MRSRHAWPLAALLALTIVAPVTRAATVTYALDQSNAEPSLADGVSWLDVGLTAGEGGAIDFSVSVLPALAGIATGDFTLKAFAFSSQGAANVLVRSNFAGLPTGWSISFGRSVGDFGTFDVLLTRSPTAPLATALDFSVTGVANDGVADYAVLSRGRAAQGHVYFAALVSGFSDQDPGRKTLTEAWFGGSAVSTVVPLPATAWLLVSGLLSVAATARRRLRPPA
jgi:hypothetical protein